MIEFSRFECYFFQLPYRVLVRDSRGREHSFGQILPDTGDHEWNLKIISKSLQADKHITRLSVRSILESYIHGEIEIEGDFRYLAQLRLYVKDPEEMVSFKDQFDYLIHCLRKSNPTIEKFAASHHYDQPIEFVEGYLDTIVRAHSCCVFGDPLSDPTDSSLSLEEAAMNRERLAAEKLQLEGKRVLDIGCGSGYFVNLAVKEFGACEAYGVTLSENQKNDADKLFEQSGTADRCHVEIKNYRDVEGQFDCINSVGMVSHIGPGMLNFYWRKVDSLLKAGGLYHHHCLMHYDSRIKQQDGLALFSRKWVWPNYHWYRLDEHIRAAEDNRFEVVDIKCLRLHYARTIDHWYERFQHNVARNDLNIPEVTKRAWRAYLANMAIGFRNREFTVNQLLCRKLEKKIVPVVINLTESRASSPEPACRE